MAKVDESLFYVAVWSMVVQSCDLNNEKFSQPLSQYVSRQIG